MGILDPILEPIGQYLREESKIVGPGSDTEDFEEDLRVATDEDTRADDIVENFFGGIFDELEDDIINELTEDGRPKPENVEERLTGAEGAAIEDGIGVLASTLALEIAGGTQLETHEEALTQITTFLVLEDILGARLNMTMEKGVKPALEADVAKETRSEFVSLQDAVEYALRNKDNDEGYLTASGATEDVRSQIGSNEPVNPENLLEEWGIRDDQLDILEEVALEAMEFEELIETPAELGLIVDDEVLDQVLDLAGYPEDLKDFLRQVPKEIPNSNRIWEERTAVEPLVQELERLAADEELTPQEAINAIPDEVEEAKPALRRRFGNLQDLPTGSPSGAEIEGSFASGYTDLSTLQERLDRLEYDTEAYDDVVRKTVLDELDGDLQEAVALGLVSEAEYADLAEFAGVDDEVIDLLLQGQSFGDITTQRLAQAGDPAKRSVRTLSGIGQSRGAGLRAAGVETVGDMASADQETVAEAAQVSPETAQQFITQAQARVS